jgi:hypothetical protein
MIGHFALHARFCACMVHHTCSSNRAVCWSLWSGCALEPNHLGCLAKTEVVSPEMFLGDTGGVLTPVPEAAPGRLSAPFDMTGNVSGALQSG